MKMHTFPATFRNKRILLTGHSGFKGSWLAIWLSLLGARVSGLSLGRVTTPSNFEVCRLESAVDNHFVDIRNQDEVASVVQDVNPDIVFHLAAQALVRESYTNPLDTICTNAMGTANLLESLRLLDKNVIMVMITSDKAYDNQEWQWGYRENDRLGGKDPYSASKGMAELVIRTYVDSFYSGGKNIRLGVARAGNVIGGGDWAADRIVPDCIKSWHAGNSVEIRSPTATRPWQHVLEPLSGYLTLAAALGSNESLHGEAFNFGPPANQDMTVRDLIEKMQAFWPGAHWEKSGEKEATKEAGLLKLNCDKALAMLGWLPTLDFHETVEMTTQWYQEYYEGNDSSMLDYTIEQIKSYTVLAAQRNRGWADGY